VPAVRVMKAGRSIEAAGGDEVTSPAHGGEVIGRCTTCNSDEHPYLRGYEVVVVAALKNALRTEEHEYLTTEGAVHAAGGTQDPALATFGPHRGLKRAGMGQEPAGNPL